MATPVGPLTRLGTASARTAQLKTLSNRLSAAAASLDPTGRTADPNALDEASLHLHQVEVILDGLAGDVPLNAEAARQLRALRDSVSGHLSAAATLRLLDLDANAALVLQRAVESVRDSMALSGDGPYPVPLSDAD